MASDGVGPGSAALESFTTLGLPVLAGRCRELLDRPRPSRWTRYGFTARETEVLTLVGQGLANKQARSRTELVALTGPPTGPSDRP